MLRIKSGGYSYKIVDATINLSYDTVADTFVFRYRKEGEAPSKPLQYQDIDLTYRNALIMKGTALSTYEDDNSTPSPASMGGYSITGILEDCQIVEFPIFFQGFTTRQVAQMICDYFGIKLVVDDTVKEVVDIVLNNTNADPMQTAKDYLSTLCKQINVVLSHTDDGKLLLTQSKAIPKEVSDLYKQQPKQQPVNDSGYQQAANKIEWIDNRYREKNPPIASFDTVVGGEAFTRMSVRTDGQRMHGNIKVIQQANVNSVQSYIINPYVGQNAKLFTPKLIAGSAYRQRAVVQTADIADYKQLTAKNVLSDELKSISLVIEVPRWVIGNHLIRPNNLITVRNPNIGLNKVGTWFIDKVTLTCSADKETAVITCCLPDCYNNEIPVANVFS